MATVVTGKSAGPLSMLADKRIVPATVPVNNMIFEPKTALVVPAGTVKLTVRVPVENCVAGSSTGTSALEENVSLICPLRGLGFGAERLTARSYCCRLLSVVESVGADKVGTGGSTISVNARETLAPRESVTVTVKVF